MSAQPHRLRSGGRIDRGRTLRFTFDDRAYHGHPGDTLASALLANGVRLVGRSFKYHRKRGIYSAGPEEPNALVRLRGGDAAYNAAALRMLLDGAAGAYRDTVLMNAGAGLVVAGKAASLEEGVAQAAQAIDSGKAAKVLERLVAASNQ